MIILLYIKGLTWTNVRKIPLRCYSQGDV